LLAIGHRGLLLACARLSWGALACAAGGKCLRLAQLRQLVFQRPEPRAQRAEFGGGKACEGTEEDAEHLV
jgi:hypothetical protein